MTWDEDDCICTTFGYISLGCLIWGLGRGLTWPSGPFLEDLAPVGHAECEMLCTVTWQQELTGWVCINCTCAGTWVRKNHPSSYCERGPTRELLYLDNYFLLPLLRRDYSAAYGQIQCFLIIHIWLYRERILLVPGTISINTHVSLYVCVWWKGQDTVSGIYINSVMVLHWCTHKICE